LDKLFDRVASANPEPVPESESVTRAAYLIDEGPEVARPEEEGCASS
jgi:hypothetical protein